MTSAAAESQSSSQGYLHMDQLTIDRIKLNTPSLAQIADALRPELLKNFKRVSADVVLCPDLTQSPFKLVSKGLGGDENVFDIGDKNSFFPIVKREKLYNVKDLKLITMSNPLFVIGPCSGPTPFIGSDNECLLNMTFVDNHVENRSHVFTAIQSSLGYTYSILPDHETRFSILANFFTSNGFTGEVLKIVCEVRTGTSNFIECIGNALSKHFGDEIIALGGVVLMENGKVKVHNITPDLDKKPLKSPEECEKWILYNEITPPLVGVGCIVSRDPGLNLRLQHFHLMNENGQGGHYLYDTEPETIKYTAYLGAAKYLTKIDNSE